MKNSLGATGWIASHETERGVIREVITKWGLHDRIVYILSDCKLSGSRAFLLVNVS